MMTYISHPPSRPSVPPETQVTNNTSTHIILVLLNPGSITATLHTVHLAGLLVTFPLCFLDYQLSH